MAMAGTMLVMSSVCQSTSNRATSLLRPFNVAMSIWRTQARQSLAQRATMAAGGVDRRAEDIAILQHPRTEVAADADGNGLLVDFELGVQNDLLLHLCGGIE